MAKKTPKNGTDSLRIETVEMSTLHLDPNNARLHSERNISVIANSLKRFGQQKPIHVDANNVIRAGNGTFRAAQSLGWEVIQIVRSNLSEAELTAYAVADNRSAELADWNTDVLEELQAQSLDSSLDDMGFTNSELDALLKGDVKNAHGFVPVKAKKQKADPDFQLTDKFQIVIDCTDEQEQLELLEKFKQQGLKFRALVA